MSRTYAMPTSPSHTSHAHSRQQANSKMPLQPPSTNSGYNYHEHSLHNNTFPSDGSFDNISSKPVEAFPDMAKEGTNASFLQLPKPSSFSSADGSRFKSMERRKSAGLPTHLNLEGTGYGYTASSTQKLQLPDSAVIGSGFVIQDIINAVLIPLPVTLVSLLFNLGAIPNIKLGEDRSNNSSPSSKSNISTWFDSATSTSSVVPICALTAMTLGLIGLGGKITQLFATSEKRAPVFNLAGLRKSGRNDLARRAAGRVLAIGLPFYSTACLGGIRVAVVTLSAMASGVTSIGEIPSTAKAWKQLLKSRQWFVVTVLVQLMADISGITSKLSAGNIFFGYLTLALLIAVSPSAHPSKNPQASRLSAQASATQSSNAEGLASVPSSATTIGGISPLVSSSEDVDLTLSVALFLSVTTFCLSFILTSSAGATSTPRLAWSTLTSFSAALAITFGETISFRKARGMGFVVGSVTSALIITFSFHDSWIHFLSQNTFIGISYAGLRLDLRAASSFSSSAHSAHHTHKHHHHTRSQPSEISGASKITNYLLPRVQHWPLLYTIIKEKDSRRIFYFMWYG